ncbi:hypothetical protein Bca52824_005368 [Brassica carinata]|uniref:Protein TIFY n=1 Tax=Brassica carinata TaxID=52824 RepID=A0A8X7WNN6_BRACI|nr:hypothetical protein Bca52824_005368 [Brassica carinata]
MSRVTTELDFFGLEKKQTNNVPKPKFKKFRPSSQFPRPTELVSGTVPMTIFYNGTVSVYQVSPNKADDIMKVVRETAPKKDKSIVKDHLVIPQTTLRTKLFGQNLEGDLPIQRTRSLQRFLEKRKERLVSISPYFPTSG